MKLSDINANGEIVTAYKPIIDDNQMNLNFISACRNGDITTVKQLINDIDVNYKDEYGFTALMWASFHDIPQTNHDIPQIVDELVKKGADMNAQNNDGWTALMFASWSGYHKIASLLLSIGANRDLQNDRGRNAYDLALKTNNLDVMLVLNPNLIHEQDASGNTLLEEACSIRRSQSVSFFYEHGADFYRENNDGISALDMLCKHDRLNESMRTIKEKLLLDELTIDDDQDLRLR